MYNLLKLKILAACLAMTMAVDMKAKLPLLGHQKLMDFMIQTRDISQRSPARSIECFNYYTPLLNDCTREYEKSYKVCIDGGDAARLRADESSQPERNQIEGSAEAACYALQACTNHSNSINYFECFANTGSDNSKAMYVMSTNASDALANMRETYRLIDNDQYRCTNNSERVYIEDTASVYQQLQNCLTGLSPVPTTTSSPVTKPTESSTVSTESTSEDTTTVASRNMNYAIEESLNPDSRHFEKDSKRRHSLRKLERHLH